VAENEARPVGELVEVGQRLIEGAASFGEYDGSAGVLSLAGERMDAPRLRGDLKIYRDTASQLADTCARTQSTVSGLGSGTARSA
ncbi:MAG: hypothetical protein OXF75_05330, partial [Acidimicrobiaceae bacterium]|nr:hypothetical protein [Acidimicrobiaceae bacterium]